MLPWRRLLLRLGQNGPHHTKRHFITSAIKQPSDDWISAAPRLTPISASQAGDYLKLLRDHVLVREGVVSAVDTESLVLNLVSVSSDVGTVEQIIRKYREACAHSEESPSLSFSTIVSFIAIGQSERLLDMLKDPLNYGIFVDQYTTCLLASVLPPLSALDVCWLWHTQDEVSSPLLVRLALVTAWRCAHQLPLAVQPDLPQKTGGDEEEDEWIRVWWVRNAFHDDHGDITISQHKLGKLFLAHSHTLPSELQASATVLGHLFTEQYASALNLIKAGPTVHEQIWEMLKSGISEAITQEDAGWDDDFMQFHCDKAVVERKVGAAEKERLLSKVGEMTPIFREGDFGQQLLASAEDSISEFLKQLITETQERLEDWKNRRTRLLQSDESLLAFERLVARTSSALEEFKRRETVLSYFENIDAIDVVLDNDRRRRLVAETGPILPPKVNPSKYRRTPEGATMVSPQRKRVIE